MKAFSKYATERYWKKQETKKKIGFGIKKYLYSFQEKRNSVKKSVHLDLVLWKNSIIKSVPYLILLFFVIRIEKYLYSIDNRYLEYLRSIITIKHDTYITLLVALLSVSGIFLGLFYTNISSIFSSRYANAPRIVGRLFENEFVSLKYIEYIVRYSILVIWIMFLELIGFKTGLLVILFVVALTVKLVITFATLGKRVYEFSDFFAIMNSVYERLLHTFKTTTCENRLSMDPNFQNHSRKLAEQEIDKMSTVLEYSLISMNINHKSISDFLDKNLYLVSTYIEIKNKIPGDSLWFREKAEYNSWFLSPDHEIQMALKTGTEVKPAKVKNLYWFEDEIFKINSKALYYMIRTKDLYSIYQYIYSFSTSFEYLLKGYSFEYIYEQMILLNETVFSWLLCLDDLDSEDEEYQLAIVDVLSFMALEYALKAREIITNDEFDRIENFISNNKYDARDRLSVNKQYINNKKIVVMLSAIENEIAVEKKVVTPEWFIRQQIYSSLNDSIVIAIDLIIKLYENIIIRNGNSLMDNQKYQLAMLCYSRETEAYSKITNILNVFLRLSQECQVRYIEKSYAWNEFQYDFMKNRINELNKDISGRMVLCVSNLEEEIMNRDLSIPDFFGFSYFNLCEDIIQAFEKCDFDNFKRVFNNLFFMIAIAEKQVNHVLEGISDTSSWSALVLRSQPITDFFFINGFAILMGELTNDKRWTEVIEEITEKIFIKFPDKKNDIIKRWKVILDIQQNRPPAIYNKDIIYSEWENRFINSAKSNGLLKFKPTGMFGHEVVDHESRLISAIGMESEVGLIGNKICELYFIYEVNNYIEDEDKYVSSNKWERKYYE